MASGFFPLAAIDIPVYGHENSPSDGRGSFIEPEVSPGQSLTARVLDRREHMPPRCRRCAHHGRICRFAGGSSMNIRA